MSGIAHNLLPIEEFENQIEQMRMHKSAKDGLALKKPLLLLLLIADIEKQKIPENRITFSQVEADLANLIALFGGRATTKPAPEQPFYHLKSSPFWQLHNLPEKARISAVKSLSSKELRDNEVFAELPKHIFQLIKHSPENRARIAEFILRKWWPETLHEEMRQQLGLRYKNYVVKKIRDPDFAQAVLDNYRHQCAFCGFSAHLNNVSFGLDAAHIKWHASNGPDELANGLALCKLHHWSLDRGVLTLTKDLTLMIAKNFVAKESESINQIEKMQGRQMREPRSDGPGPVFVEWHRENVFMG